MPASRSAKPGRRSKIEVSSEERNHLIADVAYFHAEHFRPVGREGCRSEDRRAAKAEIAAVLGRCRKR